MLDKIRISFFDNEIIRKGSISLFWKIFGALISFVFLTLVTRLLGVNSWGIFVLCLSILNISSIFSRLGVDILVLKLISSAQTRINEIKNIYFSGLLIVLISSLIVSIILYIFSTDLLFLFSSKNESINYIKYICFVIPLFSILTLNEQSFRGLKQIGLFSFFRNTSKMLFGLIFLLYFYYFLENNDIMLPFKVFQISLCIVLFISTIILLKRFSFIERINFFSSKKMLTSSVPMMLSSSIMLLMSWVDTLMIGGFIGEYEVGLYNVAVRVSLITSITLTAINSITAPKISETFNSGRIEAFKSVVKESTKTIFLSTLPIIGVIFLFPDLILSLFGKDFLLAKTSLFILAFSQIINSMSGSVAIILNMTGKEKVFRNIIFVALVINILLNLLLIPKFGIEGAAIASASSLIFWNLYSVYYVYKELGVMTFISYEK